jgi:hypothetical protein
VVNLFPTSSPSYTVGELIRKRNENALRAV